MIVWNGKEPSEIHWQGKDITMVVAYSELVWQATHSCYGSGIWIDELVWTNDDVWVD